MSKNKGHPRCERCEGKGIIRAGQRFAVCECVRGKPNRALLKRLAALDIPDFAEYDDAWRRERGLPPFVEPTNTPKKG